MHQVLFKCLRMSDIQIGITFLRGDIQIGIDMVISVIWSAKLITLVRFFSMVSTKPNIP